MKRLSLFALIMAMVLCLTGCGGSADNGLADKLQEMSDAGRVADTDAADDTDGKEAETKPEKPAKKGKKDSKSDNGKQDIPKFYISTERENDYPYEDTYLLRHTYEQIHMEDYRSNGILADQLEALNEDIGINEQELRDEESKALEKLGRKEIESLLDGGSDLINEEWNIYVRRADSDILSVACQFRSYNIEGDDVVMTAHTYSMDTGEELALSDVVDDEDAFYKLLARELEACFMREMMLYGNDTDGDSFDGEKELKSLLDAGRYSWVLDPQGITYWFENVGDVIGHMSVAVLFSDDEDGKIFNKKYAGNVPDEWIMQIPGKYSDTRFDCDDDGYTDTVSWMTEKNEGGGFTFESGINFFYNDQFYPAVDICPPNGNLWLNTKAMLVHRDSSTVLVTEHYEDLYPYINTFVLKGDDIERAGSEEGGFACPDPDVGSGTYVPQDVSDMDIFVIPDETFPEETEQKSMSIDSSGKITIQDTSAKGSRSSGINSSDAAAIADTIGGKVCVVECHDYDGDGAGEAFAVIGDNDDNGGYLPAEIWFISSEGDTMMMRDKFEGMSLYDQTGTFYMDYPEENAGFFYGDCGGYGSGWLTFVYGVRDGKPYELNISMKTEGFYRKDSGEFYTLTDDFTDGHDYMITPLTFNSKTGEFKKGIVTDESWFSLDAEDE